MNQIITTNEAREKGLKYYFTGKPCKHGHVSKRTLANGTCCECTSLKQKSYYKKDPDRIKEKRNQYRKENWEHLYARRKQKKQEQDDNKTLEELQYDRALACFKSSMNRAKQKQLLDPTADGDKIFEVYLTCQKINDKTGSMHHVDHIIPYKCGGLHHHENLQILSAIDNIRKDRVGWQ